MEDFVVQNGWNTMSSHGFMFLGKRHVPVSGPQPMCSSLSCALLGSGGRSSPMAAAAALGAAVGDLVGH